MLAFALVTVAALGLEYQPPAPGAPAKPVEAAKPAAPAAQAPAAPVVVGPWKVNEASWYSVMMEKGEEASSAANPGAGRKMVSNSNYLVRITPTKLEGDARIFTLKLEKLSTSIPTPMGEMSFDSAAPKADPAFGDLLKPLVGAEVTITIAKGEIASITGNEKLTEGSGSPQRLAGKYFGDSAIVELVGQCFIVGNGGGKLEPGATWIIGGKSILRGIVEVDHTGQAKVEKIEDGVAQIVHSASGKPTVKMKLSGELADGTTATGTSQSMGGTVRWNVEHGRLISADTDESYGFQVKMQEMEIESVQSRRTVITPVAAPAEKPAEGKPSAEKQATDEKPAK